jgi:cytochrome c1
MIAHISGGRKFRADFMQWSRRGGQRYAVYCMKDHKKQLRGFKQVNHVLASVSSTHAFWWQGRFQEMVIPSSPPSLAIAPGQEVTS